MPRWCICCYDLLNNQDAKCGAFCDPSALNNEHDDSLLFVINWESSDPVLNKLVQWRIHNNW